MANKPQLKAVGEQDSGNSDPFAELTRIMGFDPRVQPTPRPEDDFHIDLEKELMGEFGGADEPREDAPQYNSAGDGPHPAGDLPPQKTAPQPLADDLEDALTSAFEQEFGEEADMPEAGPVAETDLPPVDESATAAAVSDDAALPPDQSAEGIPDEMDAVADRGPELAQSLNQLLSNAGYKSGTSFSGTAQVYEIGTSYAAATPASEASAEPEEPETASSAPSASEDMQEVQSSSGQRSTVFGTLSPEWTTDIPDVSGSDAPLDDGPENTVAAGEASFADEAMIEDEDPFAALAAFGSESSPEISRQDISDLPDVSGQPEVSYQPETPLPSSELSPDRPVGEPQRFEGAARFYSSPDMFSRATPVPPGMKQPPRVATPAAPASAPEAPQPVVPYDVAPAVEEDAVLAAPVPEREDETGVTGDAPQEWSADFAPETPETSEASGQPSPEARDPQPDADDIPARNEGDAPVASAPEIETIAIPEPAVAIDDDLDIPALPVEEAPPAPAFDDIDGEFVAAFASFQATDFKGANVQDSKTLQHAASSNEDEELTAKIEELFAAEEFDLAEHAPAAAARPAMQGGSTIASRGPAAYAGSPEAYGLQGEDYGAAAAPAYADAAEEPAAYPFSQPLAVRDRRGPLVAAVIGCVVIAGAVGVYGYSHHAAEDSGPVLLKADSQPIKVKPKHPGGTKVPNQDNQVYKRVADGDVPPSVEQQKLVTSAEKPVDLDAQAESGTGASVSSLPGVEMSKIPQASSQEIAALAKADANQPQKNQDRLPASPATGADTSRIDDVIAVEPRKVRTMIVKPDGTMVPTPVPASASKSVESAALGAAKMPAGAKSNGIVVTPQHVDVTPSRPAGQSLPADEPARDEKVASVAPAQATAAASGWAVQIASQPSAAAAQASYQNLAHRYGDILGGHGVDIVKAEIAGKGTYYRVRIPISSHDEATALCSKYKAAGGSCFVAR